MNLFYDKNNFVSFVLNKMSIALKKICKYFALNHVFNIYFLNYLWLGEDFKYE